MASIVAKYRIDIYARNDDVYQSADAFRQKVADWATVRVFSTDADVAANFDPLLPHCFITIGTADNNNADRWPKLYALKLCYRRLWVHKESMGQVTKSVVEEVCLNAIKYMADELGFDNIWQWRRGSSSLFAPIVNVAPVAVATDAIAPVAEVETEAVTSDAAAVEPIGANPATAAAAAEIPQPEVAAVI